MRIKSENYGAALEIVRYKRLSVTRQRNLSLVSWHANGTSAWSVGTPTEPQIGQSALQRNLRMVSRHTNGTSDWSVGTPTEPQIGQLVTRGFPRLSMTLYIVRRYTHKLSSSDRLCIIIIIIKKR